MSILIPSLISVFLGSVLSDNHLEPPYGGPYYMPRILCRGLLSTAMCVGKNYIYTDGCNLILCTDLFQGTYSFGSRCKIELADYTHYKICQKVRWLGWKRRKWAMTRRNIWIRRMSKNVLFILFLMLNLVSNQIFSEGDVICKFDFILLRKTLLLYQFFLDIIKIKSCRKKDFARIKSA